LFWLRSYVDGRHMSILCIFNFYGHHIECEICIDFSVVGFIICLSLLM